MLNRKIHKGQMPLVKKTNGKHIEQLNNEHLFIVKKTSICRGGVCPALQKIHKTLIPRQGNALSLRENIKYN